MQEDATVRERKATPSGVFDRSANLVTGPALGQKEVSKEHQLTPLIQMGLFMDSSSIPVCMDIFLGNMNDSDILEENLDGFKKEYGIKKTIVVADKGMNCSHNIDLLCSQGDGWHMSANEFYKYKLIEEEYKSADIRFELHKGIRKEVKTPVRRMRKVLLYWSRVDAQMARKKREEKRLSAKRISPFNTHSFFVIIRSDFS